MASTFTEFRKLLSLLWKNQLKIPDCSLLFTGCTFSVAGSFLGAICLAYGASWMFALLYILLVMAGSIICCSSGYKIFSTQVTELLPLVSSKSKNTEWKTMPKKISSKDCNLFSFYAEEKRKNYSVNPSLHRGISCGHKPHPTHTKTENTNGNEEKITYVDCHSNRYASVCHEQYITGPAPRRRNHQKTRDERQPQARGAVNFVRKIFRLPSVFKRRVSNPTPQAEIGLSDFHRNISEEEVLPFVGLSRSETAEEGGDIPKDMHDTVEMQTEQSASRDVFQRTYENLLPPGRQKGMIPQTSHLSSGTRQDNTSDILQSFDVLSPYQNVPSHDHRIIDTSPSKRDISSIHTEKSVPFSPERCYANVVARDPPKTYRDYENISQIRPGYYVPVHSEGPYYNITASCQKSKAVSDTTSRSAYSSQAKHFQDSPKADKKSLLSAIAVSEKRMTSTGQLADVEEEIRGKRNQPVDSFYESGVSSPYVNIPASWWQMIKYRQYKDAAENIKQSSSSTMEKYASVSDKISLENVSRTRDKFSNTQSDQNFMSLGYDLSHLNSLSSFDSERQQTSIYGTSKSLEHVYPSRTQRRYEVEERKLQEKPYDKSNTSPLQDCCRTDTDKIKGYLLKERKSIPFALEGACRNIQLSKDYEEHSNEIPEAAPAVQNMNQSKLSKSLSITDKRVSTRKPHRRKEKPQERHLQSPEIRNESQSEDLDLPYSGRLGVNVHPTSIPERKASDVHSSAAVTKVKNLPKSERRSEIIRSETERNNIDESFTAVQRLLPLSDKNQFRVPPRQSRHVVLETKPECSELLPREELQFQTKEFSNKVYYSISELETKRCNVPQLHSAHPFGLCETEKPESEQYYDTESEDFTLLAELQRNIDSKRKEGNKTREEKIDTFIFRPDFMNIKGIDSSRKSFIKSGVNIESNQSASHKLSLRKGNLLDLSMSRGRSYERELNLLASDEHYGRERNMKKYTSRDEASAALKVQLKKIPVTSLRSADEVYAKLHMSKVKINPTEASHSLPLKFEDKPSGLEEYLSDTTESSDSDREVEKGKRDPERMEHMYVTGIGPLRMSYITPHSSGLQSTESVQRNPTDVKREYGNPTVKKGIHSTERQLLETEKVPEKMHETDGKKADVLRSQGPLFSIVGSSERPTQCQASERADAPESSTPEFGGDDPVKTERSVCNEMNETSNSSQDKESLMEQGISNPNFYLTRGHADESAKTEVSPRRPTEKYTSFAELGNMKSEGSRTVRPTEDIHSYSDGTSEKHRRFVSDCERNIIPVSQYVDDVYQLEPRVARTMSSGDADKSLEKSFASLSVAKSSHSSEKSSPVVSYTPQCSPSKVKTLIQVHGRNPLPRNSCQGVPPAQQRFVSPSEKIVLPVIRSSVSSTIARYPLTQTKSASLQQLKTLSPLKNLSHRSAELVSRTSHPGYVSSLEDRLSKRSLTKTADPISRSFLPSSQMIATSPTIQCLEKSTLTTGRQLKTKSASKQQIKSVSVSLPETPLTLLRSPKKTP